MSLIYVTGIAGSGKSEVCKELNRLGYEAHEADHNLSFFYNNNTGEIVQRPIHAGDRTEEWRSQHTWKMSREKLVELKNKEISKPIFICGVASNEDEYVDLFDKVFALDIDFETMMKRINSRTTSDFGKTVIEQKALLEWYETTDERYKKIGAQLVDSARPVSIVVQEMLASI